MTTIRIILTCLAVISAFIAIRAEYLGFPIYIYIFKPLATISIFLIAFSSIRGNFSKYNIAILFGLLFSLGGDVFLMLPSDQFIAALVSFLVAHLFYIFAFTTGRRVKLSLAGFPFLLYSVLIYLMLYPYLEAMKLPVLAYVAVILIMGWQAFERWNLSKNTFTLLAFAGAVLFIFSDSILAWNKFREPFEIARALNLSTYFIAQWMIALSVLQRK
jgi:uncharacterized membrane protein YhhN